MGQLLCSREPVRSSWRSALKCVTLFCGWTVIVVGATQSLPVVDSNQWFSQHLDHAWLRLTHWNYAEVSIAGNLAGYDQYGQPPYASDALGCLSFALGSDRSRLLQRLSLRRFQTHSEWGLTDYLHVGRLETRLTVLLLDGPIMPQLAASLPVSLIPYPRDSLRLASLAIEPTVSAGVLWRAAFVFVHVYVDVVWSTVIADLESFWASPVETLAWTEWFKASIWHINLYARLWEANVCLQHGSVASADAASLSYWAVPLEWMVYAGGGYRPWWFLSAGPWIRVDVRGSDDGRELFYQGGVLLRYHPAEKAAFTLGFSTDSSLWSEERIPWRITLCIQVFIDL